MKLSQGKIRQQISRRIKDALVSTLRHYDRAQSNNGSTISTVDDVGHPYIDKLVREMVNTLYKDGLDDLEGLGDTKLKVPTIEGNCSPPPYGCWPLMVAAWAGWG